LEDSPPQQRWLAVCGAMRWELHPVLRALGRVQRVRHHAATVWRSRDPRLPVLVYRTGMGQQPADAATRAVIDAFPVGALINTGCAEALVPGLRIGALVIPRAVCDANTGDGRVFSTAPAWVERLELAAASAGLSVDPGPLHSAADPLTTVAAKRDAHSCTGATAVEMEAAAVAAVASRHGIDFAVVRSILDDAATELPTWGAKKNSDGLIRRFKLNLDSVAHPPHLPPLLALARGVNEVRTALQSVFGALFTAKDLGNWFEIRS
jgi:nucleoside phosphorylase